MNTHVCDVCGESVAFDSAEGGFLYLDDETVGWENDPYVPEDYTAECITCYDRSIGLVL